ncbi:hypothetical protein PENSPDRAFT_656325 [Peniophora sp. CONT]|nr:hypothetical protein PENSPDRAFT_656325 [Peniophora sp. CONT]
MQSPGSISPPYAPTPRFHHAEPNFRAYLSPQFYLGLPSTTPVLGLSRAPSPTETVVNQPPPPGHIPTRTLFTVKALPARQIESIPDDARPHRVSHIARRVHGWSWQAFPVGMGTGAVYVSINGLKQQSSALRTVETVFFFLNLVLFCINVSTLAIQAVLYPRQAKRLVTDPSKNIYVPLVVLSYATLLIGAINYDQVPDNVRSDLAYILFWIYVGLAVAVSFPLLMIWFNRPHDIRQFSPAWMFLVFPMMLVGVVAFNVLEVMDPAEERTLGVLFVGYFFQGLGSCVTILYIAIYFIRLMMTGFMEGHQANGAFIAVGPPGFTALSLIKLGAQARDILPRHAVVADIAGEVWYSASVLAALMMFGLAGFLVIFGALPYWFKLHRHLNEILGCWALTFPNVGWIGCLGALADALNVPGLRIVQIVFVVVLSAIWIVLAVLTVVAFCRGLIFYDKADDVIADATHIFEKTGHRTPRSPSGQNTPTVNIV